MAGPGGTSQPKPPARVPTGLRTAAHGNDSKNGDQDTISG